MRKRWSRTRFDTADTWLFVCQRGYVAAVSNRVLLHFFLIYSPPLLPIFSLTPTMSDEMLILVSYVLSPEAACGGLYR